MTLSIAIIYTGELRTIEKTMYYFKRNILEANPSIHVHVFAILQNQSEKEEWIRENMGGHLKSLEWFEKTDATWKVIQTRLLNKMNITPRWKDYLEKSGSMIEYYQLYLAYSNMVQYEYNSDIRYDFVMRIRPDIVINKPIDFSIFRQNESYYVNLLDTIRVYLGENIDDTEITKKQMYIFVNSLFDGSRHRFMEYMHSNTIMEKHYNENKELDDLIRHFSYESLKQYIHRGNYVISLRKNVVYLAGRENFGRIATLGTTYGLQKMGNEIWFDAESQFETVCIQAGYNVFNTTTVLEDKSLYEYNRDNYYNEDGALKHDSSFLFFICRQ